MKLCAGTLWVLLFLCGTLCAQSTAPSARPTPRKKSPIDQNKFALIIKGASGEASYAKQFDDWTTQLKKVLSERFGFPEKQLILLTETPKSSAELPATAQQVRLTFGSLKSSLASDNVLFVFFIGHGSFDGKEAKFNLVGPDLSALEYSNLLATLPTKRIVIFNLSSASGEFIKSLSAKGRVIVTATRNGQEQNATHYPEFLLRALDADDVDTDQDGHISILEAFNYANRLTAEFFTRAGRLASEHALLDDNGDGMGREKADGGEGLLARATYLDSLNVEEAAANVATAKMLRERTRLEGEIEELISKKSSLSETEYEANLERLFIELAKLNRSIKQAGS